MTDFKELDEAVVLLQSLIKKQERGSLSVNYGQQIGMSVLFQAHRVLDLLAGMGQNSQIECTGDSNAYKWRVRLDCHIPYVPTCAEYSHDYDKDPWFEAMAFPAAVLAAVTSVEFLKWKEPSE